MRNNDSVSLTTEKECHICSSGIIFQKFTAEKVGMYAIPIVESDTNHDEHLSDYFCENCGVKFLATPKNKLADWVYVRLKKAVIMLKDTVPCKLARNLSQKEVFVMGNNEEGEWVAKFACEEDMFILKKDMQVRIHDDNKLSFGVVRYKNPFIVKVPARFGIVNKLIFWSEPIEKPIPNEPLEEWLGMCSKNEEKVEVEVVKNDELLSDDAIPAIGILVPEFGFKELYILADALAPEPKD